MSVRIEPSPSFIAAPGVDLWRRQLFCGGNYYGVFYKSALYPTLRHLDRKLVLWATRKYKRLRGHRRRAAHWLERIAREKPRMFAHWRLLWGQTGWEEPDESRGSSPVL